MKLQRLMGVTRKAIEEYDMIQEGDRIAIGISGGKDSLVLLYALNGLKKFYPKNFELVAITVHLGYEDMDFEPVRLLCESMDIPYHLIHMYAFIIILSIGYSLLSNGSILSMILLISFSSVSSELDKFTSCVFPL